ncbi:MAG TPA: DUF86 domain-containing protein [Thermoanaerobaculia bacterium]
MVDRDVVTAKLAVIERCIARIQDVQGQRKKDLLPIDVDDITALNLQRAVQAAIDLATHVVAAEGYGTPDSTADAFALLERRAVIDSELAGRLRRMVGFRNIAIHEYQSLDPAIIERIVDRHLGDLRELGARIVDAFGLC